MPFRFRVALLSLWAGVTLGCGSSSGDGGATGTSASGVSAGATGSGAAGTSSGALGATGDGQGSNSGTSVGLSGAAASGTGAAGSAGAGGATAASGGAAGAATASATGSTTGSPLGSTGSASGATTGAALDGGSTASSGASASGASGASSGASTGATGSQSAAADPFGCKFAWGEPDPGGSLASVSWLQFLSTWLGSEIRADGSAPSCSACSLLSRMAGTELIPVYYAYIIGFYGHANGLKDQNQNPNGPNLANGASALILGAANAACPSGEICAMNKIVQAYAYYAQESHKLWPTKPLLWLLEGDFIQYTSESGSQTRPLTYPQLGQLAALITTAIKTNMPNAVVAIDDSTWVGDANRKSYWTAMQQANYDMVWTSGVGNNGDNLQSGNNNPSTSTYSFLHSFTGKQIWVDESGGLSQAGDTWSNQSAARLNTLIGSGVVAVEANAAPSSYKSNVTALSGLKSTCP